MTSMTIKSFGAACLLGLSLTAWAQRDVELMDWKEGDVPPPPAFSVEKLLTFEVSRGSSLVYGVDPDTLVISDDGVVRYVMVATSPSGARNVMYEGIRCVTAEVKTYARYTSAGVWSKVPNAEWQSLYANMPSKHALQFARAGACDSSARASSVREIVRLLKSDRFNR
jgi:hypothetical protein